MSEPTTPQQQQLDTVIESGEFQGYKKELEDFQNLDRDGKKQRFEELKHEIDFIIGRFKDPYLHTLKGLLNDKRREFEAIVRDSFHKIKKIEDMSIIGRYEIVMKSIIKGDSKIDDLKEELLKKEHGFGLSPDEIQRLILYPLFHDRGIFEIFDSAEEALIVTIASAAPCIGLTPPWGPYMFATIAGAAGVTYVGWQVGKVVTTGVKYALGQKGGEEPKEKLDLSEQELAKAIEDAKKGARNYMIEHPEELDKMKIKLENGDFRKMVPLNPESGNHTRDLFNKMMSDIQHGKEVKGGGKRRTRKGKKSNKRSGKKAKKTAKRKARKARKSRR
jgi:hypothetical protein